MNKKSSSSMEDLGKIFSVLLKHIKLIISVSVLTVAIFGVAVFCVVKPKYQSTAEIIVNQKLDKDAQAAEQQQVQSTDLQLVNTYKSILNSETISSAVRNGIGSKSYNSSQTIVSTDVSSQVITISVKASKPQDAARIANFTATTFKKKIKSIMNVNNVSIIGRAKPNSNPVFPKKGLSLVLGLIVGVILGSAIALLREFNDTRISSKDFITDELNLTYLGTISDINMKTISNQIKK